MEEQTGILVGLILAATLKYGASWWMRRRRNHLFEQIGKVSKIFIYPVKSCKGVQLTEGTCTIYGIENNGVHDRGFVIVKSDGNIVHQRQYPRMVLIAIEDKGENLEFTAPGKQPISIPKTCSLARNGFIRVELFFGETMEGQDCGDDIARWVNDYLGEQGFRLVRYLEGMEPRNIHGLTWKVWDLQTAEGDTVEANDRTPTEIDVGYSRGTVYGGGDYDRLPQVKKAEPNAMYSDAATYLVVNQSSLDELNSRMERPLTELSFRPNIVVEGPEPFDEDDWVEIKIGDRVRMRCTDACNRCSLTTVDPDKGVIAKDGEPLKSLRKYRCDAVKYGPDFKESPTFGVNTSIDFLGTIKVGDPVYAIRK